MTEKEQDEVDRLYGSVHGVALRQTVEKITADVLSQLDGVDQPNRVLIEVVFLCLKKVQEGEKDGEGKAWLGAVEDRLTEYCIYYQPD